jgi:hypothetical protein
MPIHHPGTGVAHDRTHLVPPMLLVAVDRTSRTSRLVLQERALLHAGRCVFNQAPAFLAWHSPATVVRSAVHPDHEVHCLLLSTGSRLLRAHFLLLLRVAHYRFEQQLSRNSTGNQGRPSATGMGKLSQDTSAKRLLDCVMCANWPWTPSRKRNARVPSMMHVATVGSRRLDFCQMECYKYGASR